MNSMLAVTPAAITTSATASVIRILAFGFI
jgi:hypothetical protein